MEQNDYIKTEKTLQDNALNFRRHRLRATPLKPSVMSLALTHRCNSHCLMCNLWKRSREIPSIQSLEMSGREILKILSSPACSQLVELDLTGGEPHLRDDLVELATGVAGLKANHLTKLRSIIITSNGLLPAKIVANYRKILEGLQRTNIDLVSVNSFDGIGKIHDTIRGTKNAYKLVTETIEGLLELKKEYPNFLAGIKATILPQNIDNLDSILDYALAKGLFHIISPVFFTAGRFRNLDRQDKLILGPGDYHKISKFYSRSELNKSYFYAQTFRFLKSRRKSWVCTAGYNYLFIEFDGKVFPCEMIATPIGDLRKQEPETIWGGPLAQAWRKGMEKQERCRTCLEPGAIRYSACAEGLSYLKFLRRLGESRFSTSWVGEGYSKYLE